MMVQERLRQAQLDSPLTPHSFRHGLATDLLENGVDLRQIQQILGHKQIATTEIYAHLTSKALRAAYGKRTQLDLGQQEDNAQTAYPARCEWRELVLTC